MSQIIKILSIRNTLFTLLSISTFLSVQSQDTIRISDLGLKPDTRANSVQVVQKALELCKTINNPVLVFPKGRYDFWPQYAIEKQYYESNTDVIPLRRCAILIEELKNLTIDCMGSDFVYHDRIQPFTIDKSQKVIIKNVSIDWDIPLTAQAEIMDVTDEYIDIAINVLESPYAIEKNKLVFLGEGWKSSWNGVMEFERDTKLISPGTGDAGCLGNGYQNYKARELQYGLVRLSYAFKRKPLKGNYLVLRHSARDHSGIFIVDSKDVIVQNLNMYHNAGLGILSQYSENLTFRNVSCVPNPGKNRILSGHDDGFHYSNCKGLITVDNCRFLALMDDPINVHGTSVRIMEKKDDHTLLCKFMHNQSIGFIWARKGEKVGFIENEAMNTVSTALVNSFKILSPELFEITFATQIPASILEGDALENLTWSPDVIIQNSFFGSNRARGILMSTPGKVVIDKNVFESSGSAILIPGDANGWYESGAVSDVLISNNTFNDPCMTSMYQFCDGIISICPEIPKADLKKPFHRNIRIENNEFHPFDYPVLYAKSVDGLTFSGNRLIRSTRFQPFHANKSALTFEDCINIKISGNKFEGDVLGKNIRLINTPVKSILVDKKQWDVQSQSAEGWRASNETVEKLSKGKSEFNYSEEKVPSYTLPDVLKTVDGRKVANPDSWIKLRRPEILELFRKNVFGRVPETPYQKSFKIVNIDKNAVGGAATLKQVEITITSSGRSLVINLTLFTPNISTKPSPVFLLIDNRGPANTDPFRKVKSEFWPVEEAIARGYGMAVFTNSDLDPDDFDDFKNGIHGLLDKTPRPDDAWGTLAAWAWGASRCMDYLVTDKNVDKDRVAVVGHSRGGKTALWAGAEDARFSMIVANESGAGGASLARRRFGETVGRINSAFPHWFCANYKKFNNNEDALPVDNHMLLALIAPRALYIDCASEDLWGDPRGCYLSLYDAVPVFKLLGTNSDIEEIMPPLNKQLISGKVAFHIRDGVHNMLLKDWTWFMDFADVTLK